MTYLLYALPEVSGATSVEFVIQADQRFALRPLVKCNSLS